MEIRFKSLSYRHGYCYNAHWDERFEGFRQNPGFFLGLNHAFYEMDGAGVQHSPLANIPREYLADYCTSFAADLLKNVGELLSGDDLPKIGCGVSVEQSRFLASIRFKDGKRQWYSLLERKVSSAESKQYDRRWFEVPAWADGGLESCFRLHREASGGINGLLDNLNLLQMIYEGAGVDGAVASVGEVSRSEKDAFVNLFNTISALHQLFLAKKRVVSQVGGVK